MSETAMANLHRNNAAEWVMVAVLYPVAMMVRFVAYVSSRLRR